MHVDEAIGIFTKALKKIGTRWPQYIESLKAHSDKNDQSQIQVNRFVDQTKSFGYRLSQREVKTITDSCPGKIKSTEIQTINIARIYD